MPTWGNASDFNNPQEQAGVIHEAQGATGADVLRPGYRSKPDWATLGTGFGTWFNGPVAYRHQTSGVDMTLCTAIRDDGNGDSETAVFSVDHINGTRTEFVFPDLTGTLDDHNEGAIAVVLSGADQDKFLVAYTGHNFSRDVFLYKSDAASDPSSFTKIATLQVPANTVATYTNFVRDTQRDELILISRYKDSGDGTWCYWVIPGDGDETNITGPFDLWQPVSGDSSLYLHVIHEAVNSRIDFALTRHPPQANQGTGEDSAGFDHRDLFHAYWDRSTNVNGDGSGGDFYKSDGTLIGTPPQRIDTGTQVFVTSDNDAGEDAGNVTIDNDGDGETHVWEWGIAYNGGNPVIVFAMLDSPTQHGAGYAYWDGATNGWLVNTIDADIGEALFDVEPGYTPGIALNWHDPSEVFVSKGARGQQIIRKYTTTDKGVTWSGEDYYSQQPQGDFIRPEVPYAPSGDGPYFGFEIIVGQGRYSAFDNYSMVRSLAISDRTGLWAFYPCQETSGTSAEQLVREPATARNGNAQPPSSGTIGSNVLFKNGGPFDKPFFEFQSTSDSSDLSYSLRPDYPEWVVGLSGSWTLILLFKSLQTTQFKLCGTFNDNSTEGFQVGINQDDSENEGQGDIFYFVRASDGVSYRYDALGTNIADGNWHTLAMGMRADEGTDGRAFIQVDKTEYEAAKTAKSVPQSDAFQYPLVINGRNNRGTIEDRGSFQAQGIRFYGSVALTKAEIDRQHDIYLGNGLSYISKAKVL